MAEADKEYRCEDCGKFDETKIPADCVAGHGKVAFMHKACSDFVLKDQTINLNARNEL
jgi:hypothetical protein